MKFFGLFSKKQEDADATITTESKNSKRSSTKSKRTSTSSSNGSGSKGSNKKSSSSGSAPSLSKNAKSKNKREANAFRTASQLMAVMNDYNPEDPAAYVTAFCNLYAEGEKGAIVAEDDVKHTALECAGLLTLLHQSCPDDYAMKHTDIIKASSSAAAGADDTIQDLFITIVGVSPCGTHNGAPLSILPGVLPAVPPSGKYIQNGEENYCLNMSQDGKKILEVQVIAQDSLTGFAGFYEACGGSLTPPPAPEATPEADGN